MESTNVILELVLWSCSPNDAASVACVSRACREIVSNGHLLWKKFLKEELGLTLPVDPNGNVCTYAVAYRVWRQSFRAYPWPLVRRAKRCWDRIRKWLQSNFPEALGTLRPGASEEDIELVEARLAVRLPEATRLLYRLCDGQEVGGDSSLGLIGGYTYYDRKVNVYVLPLNEVEVETKSGAEGRVVVAKSSLSTAKMFFLDCEDRQLSVGTDDGRALPCVPVSDLEDDPAADGLLLWLEQHVRRLEDGAIKLDVREPRSISQFPPEDALDCITTVKRGVQVRASAVLAPESTLMEWGWYEFAYRIWLSLGPEGGVLKDGTSFQSCQLVTRQWRIYGSDGLVEKDDPQPGVRGQFPILQAGGEEFVYESCVTLPYEAGATEAGSLHGAYTFTIAGRDKDLRVRLNPLPLMRKEYIF